MNSKNPSSEYKICHFKLDQDIYCYNFFILRYKYGRQVSRADSQVERFQHKDDSKAEGPESVDLSKTELMRRVHADLLR